MCVVVVVILLRDGVGAIRDCMYLYIVYLVTVYAVGSHIYLCNTLLFYLGFSAFSAMFAFLRAPFNRCQIVYGYIYIYIVDSCS